MSSVKFLYLNTKQGSPYFADCQSVPQVGDVVMTDKGRAMIVDHLMHLTDRGDNGKLFVIPHVVLRPMRESEQERFGWSED